MTNPLAMSFLVGCGGFFGSMARYGLSLASQRFAVEWPLGTFSANVAGCLLLGILTGIAALGESISPELRLALATGFCGGFTTMSSMIYETTELMHASEYLHATLYMAGSLLFSMIAFSLGSLAVRVVLKTGGGLWN